MSQRGRILWRIVTPVIAALLAFAGISHAQGLTLNDLVEKANELDGQEVTITGEAIGDRMLRGEYGWINVGDGTNVIGVRAPAALLSKISHTGRYGRKGDTIRVTGTFFRMDAQSGGDLDIRASTLEIVEPGATVSHPVRTPRVVLAAVMSLAGGSAAGLWWRRRAPRPASPVVQK